jgi:hypothetical protein
MRNKGARGLLPLAFLLCGAVQASPVSYDIDFTAFNFMGPPPTSGSFDYDASAPIGSQFSDFVVIWDGFSFNLTASANAPFSINSDTSTCIPSIDSAGFFAGLANPSNCFSLSTYWTGTVDAGTAEFNIAVGTASNNLEAHDLESTSYSGAPLNGQGDWTISAVPEPGTLPLLLLGALALLGTTRIQMLRLKAHQSQS